MANSKPPARRHPIELGKHAQNRPGGLALAQHSITGCVRTQKCGISWIFQLFMETVGGNTVNQDCRKTRALWPQMSGCPSVAFYLRIKKKKTQTSYLPVLTRAYLCVLIQDWSPCSLYSAPWPPPRPLPGKSESVCTVLSPCSHVSYSCPLLREVLLTTPLNVAYPFPVILVQHAGFLQQCSSKTDTYIIPCAYGYIDLFVCLSPHLDEVTGDQESYLFHSLSSPTPNRVSGTSLMTSRISG